MMGYFQFKKVWLSLVDVRAELGNRHEKFNRFLPDSMLIKKLEVLVNLEETQEAKTLLEAANALDDEKIARERRDLVDEALILSRVVLGEALDAAGQVYMFGRGPFNSFDGDPVEPDFVDFMEYEAVKELWKERVRPNSTTSTFVEPANPPAPETNDISEKTSGSGLKTAAGNAQSASTAPNNKAPSSAALQSLSRIAVAAAAQAFANRQVSLVTAFLWGKRVKHIACGSAVAYAVTDSGEVFCWGGKQREWQYFYDHSTLKDGADGYSADRPQSKGGARPLAKELGRPLTTRSEMLKFSVPSQVAENQTQYDQLHLRRKYRNTFVKPERILPTEEDKQRRLILVGRYYDLLPAEDPSSQKALPSLHELMETVEPELNVDDLALSLQMRGVYLAKQTRIELMEKLGTCLELELECVGEKFHDHLKEQDKIARRFRHDRMEKSMLTVAAGTAVLWYELCTLLENLIKVDCDSFSKDQHEYLEMKRKILAAKQKVKRQAKEGFFDQQAVAAAGGNNKRLSLLHANGLTSRGSPLENLNGQHAVECIAVGSRHALAVHQSGKLLTWGVGAFGRLGGAHDSQRKQNQNDPNSWHEDVHTPEVVDALKAFRFRSVACGFGHSLALSTQGKVFVWGSATHGKLGIGKVAAAESFTLSPMPLPLPSGVLVRKIACGPSHSALLTTDGHLYVWGSGDGGKLGLGDGRDIGQNLVPRNGGKLGLVSTPTRVLEPFTREKLVDVSCGAGHTVVVSASTKTGDRKQTGGQVYVAGSNHALAKFTPTFTLLPLTTDDSNTTVAIAKVSCGNAHTALVSTEGELFTWGTNVGGCTGHAVLLLIIKTPTRVSCMYQRPVNLCLLNGVTALHSTQNATCLPEYALRRGYGDSALVFSQTQQEMCPFWQVALETMGRIESVRVVMKTSTGSDDGSLGGNSTKRTSASAGAKYSILISQFPFDTEERGKYSLAKAKSHSTHVAFTLPDDQTVYVWSLPIDTLGQFVRVQIENAAGMLSLHGVEVVGMDSSEYKGPRVTDVECGDGVTAAICRPLSSVDMLRERFLRAVRADRASLWILEQIETFHPFLQEELVRLGHCGRACILCRPRAKCVVCQLEEAILTDGKVIAAASNPYSAPADSPSSKARKLEVEEKEKEALRQLTIEELCQKLLTMSMRTEKEEEEQQKRLEQELLDAKALTVTKQQPALVEKHVDPPQPLRPDAGLLAKLRKALGLGRSSNQKEY